MGFFDLPMHGGPTRPAAYKFFNFHWNDPIFGKSKYEVKLYPIEPKQITLLENYDDVSNLKNSDLSDWLIRKSTYLVNYLRYNVC